MAAHSGTLRRRKAASKSKDRHKGKGGDPSNSATTSNNNNDVPEADGDVGADPTLASVFFSHPLIRVGRFILIPFLLFHALNYVALQRPEWVGMATSGIVKLRPSLSPLAERQVLIVGASVHNNKLVAITLADSLKLEVAHETFDSLHNYCRDGSTSWYQFMRFLSYYDPTRNNNNNNNRKKQMNNATQIRSHKMEAFQELCLDRSSALVTHLLDPRKYDSSTSECSSRDVWSPCWSRECFRTLQDLWDCTSSSKNGEFHSSDEERFCKPSFRRILHQTRHPLSTIQQLNETYCSNEKMEYSFRKIVAGFFPQGDWGAMQESSSLLSCWEVVAWYTLDFESTMLHARQAGVVDDMFPLESTSPCEVATLAEFTNPTQAIFSPHVDRLTTICHSEESSSSSNSNKATSKQTFVPRAKGMQSEVLTWDGLATLVANGNKKNMQLVQSLKTLTKELGYGEGTDSAPSEFI